MKRKNSRIFGILIAIVMLASIFVLAAGAEQTEPASYVILDERAGGSSGKRLDSSAPYLVNGEPSAAGTLGVDGCTVYYDAQTKTLHLKDSVNEITSVYFKAEPAESEVPMYNYTINVIGKNVIKSEDYIEKIDAAGNSAKVAIIANRTNGDITITSQSGGTLDIVSKGIVREYYSIQTGNIYSPRAGSVSFTGNVSVKIDSTLHEIETSEIRHGDNYGIFSRGGVSILDDSNLTIRLRNSKTGHYRSSYGIYVASISGLQTGPSITVNTTGNFIIDCSNTLDSHNNTHEVANYPRNTILENAGAMILLNTADGRYTGTKIQYDNTRFSYIEYYVERSCGYDNYRVFTENGRLAIVDDITISGTKWRSIAPVDIMVRLIGDTFAENAASTRGWVTNLPHGMVQSITILDETTAKITVSGVPSDILHADMEITIPAAALTNGENDIAVHRVNAMFDIGDGGVYNVRFNANGGTGHMATVGGIAGGYTQPRCTFTPPVGKEFVGWALSEDGSALGETEIVISADTTLYAVWQEKVAETQTKLAIYSREQWEAAKDKTGQYNYFELYTDLGVNHTEKPWVFDGTFSEYTIDLKGCNTGDEVFIFKLPSRNTTVKIISEGSNIGQIRGNGGVDVIRVEAPNGGSHTLIVNNISFDTEDKDSILYAEDDVDCKLIMRDCDVTGFNRMFHNFTGYEISNTEGVKRFPNVTGLLFGVGYNNGEDRDYDVREVLGAGQELAYKSTAQSGESVVYI